MLKKGSIVFGNWTVEERIGSGAFGTVYKIKREDFGEEYVAAMKVIRIPQDKDDKKRLYSEGMNDRDIALYYKQIAVDFIKEIKMLSSLDGVTNIVDYKDHVIEPNEDFGYTIYIKMQLLTPISQLLVGDGNNAEFLTNEEIIKLGKDMCSALEVCEKKRIIHRDIKIDNIFISENGDYKLGDFGIARQLEGTQGEMSKKGTLMYMAPEVFKGEKYDRTADIYSLGIVLYRLLNKNRAPFFPDYPQPIKFTDKEQANNKRLSGETVPPIAGLSDELNAILRKACAYNPRDRYQSASEFKKALCDISTLVELDEFDTLEINCFGIDDFLEPSTTYRDFMDSVGKSDIVTIEETVDVHFPKNVFFSNVKSTKQTTYRSLAEVKQQLKENDNKELISEERTIVESVFADSSDEETVSLFDNEAIAEITVEDKKTEAVFKRIPVSESVLSDTFFEKDTVTLADSDDKKTVSIFPVATSIHALSDEDESETEPKKKINIKLIAIVIAILLVSGICMFFADDTNGDENNVDTTATTQPDGDTCYEIYTAEDLFEFADEVNSGRNPYANAILMNDIDLNPGYLFGSDGTVTYNGEIVTEGWRYWEPIGFGHINFVADNFIHYYGSFDGNGYTVSGIYINRDSSPAGFFGYIDAGAVIENLCIDNSYVYGSEGVGGIVGFNNGTIDSCVNSGFVGSHVYNVGGIAGANSSSGLITSCTNTGLVVGADAGSGGIVAFNEGTVESCSNSGDVSCFSRVGGVVGNNYGTVDSCTNSGNVNGEDEFAGGVIGYNEFDGTIACSYYAYSAEYGIGYCGEHAQYNCTNHSISSYY